MTDTEQKSPKAASQLTVICPDHTRVSFGVQDELAIRLKELEIARECLSGIASSITSDPFATARARQALVDMDTVRGKPS